VGVDPSPTGADTLPGSLNTALPSCHRLGEKGNSGPGNGWHSQTLLLASGMLNISTQAI
jgi:hypothetical protein